MHCWKTTMHFRSAPLPCAVASCTRVPRHYCHEVSHLSTAAAPAGEGYLAKLASTQCVHAAEMLFCAVHDSAHLPWWAVIVTTTFTLRALATSPLAVHQAKMAARAELLLPTLRELQEAVKHRVVAQCRREGVALEEANRRMMREARNDPCHCVRLHLHVGKQCVDRCVVNLVVVCGGAAGPSPHPPTLLVPRLPPGQDVPPPLDPAPLVAHVVPGSTEHVGGVARGPSRP